MLIIQQQQVPLTIPPSDINRCWGVGLKQTIRVQTIPHWEPTLSLATQVATVTPRVEVMLFMATQPDIVILLMGTMFFTATQPAAATLRVEIVLSMAIQPAIGILLMGSVLLLAIQPAAATPQVDTM